MNERYNVFPAQTMNKRKYKRIRWAEAVEVFNPHTRHQLGSLAHDLSLGGLRVSVSEFFPLKSDVTVKFRLDEERYLECKAKVVWVKDVPFTDSRYYLGLEFDQNDLTRFEAELIKHLVGN